jgi:Ca2+-binding EF-hand superfamily protein
MEQMIDAMFQDMDANHDGKISKKEWMAAQERHFNQLDKNGDGFVTKDEIRSDMMERMRSSQPPPPQQGGRAPQYPQ